MGQYNKNKGNWWSPVLLGAQWPCMVYSLPISAVTTEHKNNFNLKPLWQQLSLATIQLQPNTETEPDNQAICWWNRYRFPVKPEEEIKIFVRWLVVVARHYAASIADCCGVLNRNGRKRPLPLIKHYTTHQHHSVCMLSATQSQCKCTADEMLTPPQLLSYRYLHFNSYFPARSPCFLPLHILEEKL